VPSQAHHPRVLEEPRSRHHCPPAFCRPDARRMGQTAARSGRLPDPRLGGRGPAKPFRGCMGHRAGRKPGDVTPARAPAPCGGWWPPRRRTGSPAHAARGTASSRLRRLASLSTTPAARDPHQCRRGRGLRSAHRVRDLQPGQHPRTRCRRVGGRPAGQVGDGAAGPGDRRLRAGPSARASADRPDPLPRQTVATGRAGFLGPPHRDRGRGRRRAPGSARRVGNTRISARQAVAKRPGGQRIRVAS